MSNIFDVGVTIFKINDNAIMYDARAIKSNSRDYDSNFYLIAQNLSYKAADSLAEAVHEFISYYLDNESIPSLLNLLEDCSLKYAYNQ